ncbi:hypothetical protein HAL013_06630 [Helicobacter ailurogastricus]|uniref:Uncharacterized protein n=1 Tax=Helicobacter ailurogastricus TaxID=1578720 RepID=A0A0K2XCM9_9HELI|nr:hypothetical protein HAL013_06630 [Helicobacter ailurogastricus]
MSHINPTRPKVVNLSSQRPLENSKCPIIAPPNLKPFWGTSGHKSPNLGAFEALKARLATFTTKTLKTPLNPPTHGHALSGQKRAN